jgi:hypothetical protein
MTFLAAHRGDGLIAPCVFVGPPNGQAFRAYADQHKAVRAAIKAAGARL